MNQTTLSIPDLEMKGLSYFVRWEEGVVIKFTKLYAHRNKDIDAFVTIWDYMELSDPKLLGPIRTAITKTWRGVISELVDISDRDDWRQRLTQASTLVQSAYEVGQPAVPLGLIESPGLPRELIQNVLWEGTPAIIFGAPGIGKSLFGLHLISGLHTGHPVAGLGVSQTNSMWLDWETNQRLAHWRNKEILDAKGIESGEWPDPDRPELARSGQVYYKQMIGSLADSVEILAEEIAEFNVGALLIDSAMPAAGGEAETGQATETFYAALRALKPDDNDLSVLIIAHVTKASHTDPNSATPFGSAFWTARARDTYELKGDHKKGANYTDMMLHHRKTNMGPLRDELAFRMTWGSGATIEAIDRTANRELVKSLSYTDRAKILLEEKGPLDTEELADLMDLNKRTLSATLSRDNDFTSQNGKWEPSETNW